MPPRNKSKTLYNLFTSPIFLVDVLGYILTLSAIAIIFFVQELSGGQIMLLGIMAFAGLVMINGAPAPGVFLKRFLNMQPVILLFTLLLFALAHRTFGPEFFFNELLGNLIALYIVAALFIPSIQTALGVKSK